MKTGKNKPGYMKKKGKSSKPKMNSTLMEGKSCSAEVEGGDLGVTTRIEKGYGYNRKSVKK